MFIFVLKEHFNSFLYAMLNLLNFLLYSLNRVHILTRRITNLNLHKISNWRVTLFFCGLLAAIVILDFKSEVDGVQLCNPHPHGFISFCTEGDSLLSAGITVDDWNHTVYFVKLLPWYLPLRQDISTLYEFRTFVYC